MVHRIEVAATGQDTRADVLEQKISAMGFDVSAVSLVDAYTIDKEFGSSDPLSPDTESSRLERIAQMLANPVTEQAKINEPHIPADFRYAIEIGFLPGVTDNVSHTVKEGIEDLLKTGFSSEEGVYSSRIIFLSGSLSEQDAISIGEDLANPLIQRISVKSYDKFRADNGMDVVVPKVILKKEPKANIINVSSMDDLELTRIGKMGVFDRRRELTQDEYNRLKETYTNNPLMSGDLIELEDGRHFQTVRRGPLALDLASMKAIVSYFRDVEQRPPTDVEIESLAQTWSEHCKHTIFANKIDDIKDGLFSTYIAAATNLIRKMKGKYDFCVSVFTDNAGVIRFDEENDVCAKVETHNSPSALDPYGGSITGIVGVNRDPMGTGMGSMPFLNMAGPYCVGDPRDETPLYKGPNFTQRMLSSRRLLEGIIDGVKDGGNCSGIPTSFFRLMFDDQCPDRSKGRNRYGGKPLVFVGTAGVMPHMLNGRPSYEKEAKPGDLIVMAGGRVGKDGIHGATFSSESMNEVSPASAVQIGDPITQKKMSDAQLELRDRELYDSVTDNGAGGLSCSVGEMAKESRGCLVQLDKVPLKYAGLLPYETWISESQERMTYAVPPEKIGDFLGVMKKHGVEATVIGEFTDSGRCIVSHNGATVMDVKMDFLHDGVPEKELKTKYTKAAYEEPSIDASEDQTQALHSMLARLNIAGLEFIVEQYDHEVQGGSVLKPLQGRGRVNGDATVTRPVLSSMKGVVLSQGIKPKYSDIDAYDMAACSIDTAVRNSVAAGVNMSKLAVLDNFCWSSSDDPERLGQLKEACRACYDTAVAYMTPFISGKDSMFNDFKGFDENGKPIKISVPPTLLITGFGIIEDSRKAVSIDFKCAGDSIYVLGETHDELGGSEYYAMLGEQRRGEAYTGNSVPKVDTERNLKLYRALSQCIDEGIIASAKSINDGLGTDLAKASMAGKLGVDVSLENLPGTASSDVSRLWSESQGRFIVSVNPGCEDRFREIMGSNAYSKIGVVKEDASFVVRGENGKEIVNTDLNKILEQYRQTFEGY